jgi:triphosphatase
MRSHIERELKLRLPARAALPLPAGAPARSILSIYYDTRDQRLRRAGMALRLRREGSVWLQTLKCEPTGHAGLSARAEWETAVPGPAIDVRAFPLDEVKRATGLDLAALARRLRRVFETRFTRRSAQVALHGRGAAELCVDRGAILAGRLREPIREVELELKAGSSAALLDFAERLALPLAYESKAERGYRLAAGQTRSPRKWRMPPLDAAVCPEAAFAALFAAALTQVGANAPGVLEGSDPEYLHQMRVGLRRLRSLLRAFAEMLERTGGLERRLRGLMRALAAARDWDVILERLGPVAPAERAAAGRRAREAVSSPEFNALLFEALRWIESRPFRRGDATLAGIGARALERLHRKACAHAGGRGAAARHALRIRVKRLRYAIEYFAPAFSASDIAPSLAALHQLQDLLGDLNDIAVARKRLAQAGIALPAAAAKRERRLIAGLPARWAAYERLPQYWRAQGRTPRPSAR